VVASLMAGFDAIVVGSGMTGGWAAKELAEAGLKVAVLERGPNIVHREDYLDLEAPWELPNLDRLPEEEAARVYPVQSQLGAVRHSTRKFWIRDVDHPYLTPEGRPFRWFQGYHLGGRSVTWGRQVYRWGPQDFMANRQDGHGIDWPIRYEDIAPWYSYVERFAGVMGAAENIPHLPDSVFQPVMPMNCGESFFKAQVERAFPTRKVISARAAHLTQPTAQQADLGRGPCMYRSHCDRGCSFGAYFSSLSATLPAAERTGNLTLMTDSLVESVIYDETTGRASGVRYVRTTDNSRQEVHARVIFMCASAIATACILLNSKSRQFPTGLCNSSGTLGRYLMDHVLGVGASGQLPGLEDRYYTGRAPKGIYIPRYANTTEHDRDVLRGWGYQGRAYRESWMRAAAGPGVGLALKSAVRSPGPWIIGLGLFGEMLPSARNRVSLHESKIDRYGIPLPIIDVRYGANEYAIMKFGADDAVAMLEAAGCTNIRKNYDETSPGGIPGEGIHEMGTARMGADPRESVLNRWNQAHDVPNLFVTDGACMVSSSNQNPSLTYMALTARAADHAVSLLRSGAL
jgi:choline dehydrogenase-like flavoprotein